MNRRPLVAEPTSLIIEPQRYASGKNQQGCQNYLAAFVKSHFNQTLPFKKVPKIIFPLKMLKHPRQKQLLMLMMLFPLIFILRWISSENNLIDHFLVFPVGSKLRLEKFFSCLCLSRFVSNQDIRTEINKRS